MHVTVLDFMLPPLMCGLGVEGPVQSNHCDGKGRRVRLKRYQSMPKAACVKSNYWGCRRGMARQTALLGLHASQPGRWRWHNRPCPVCPRSAFLGFVRRSKGESCRPWRRRCYM